MKDSEIPALTNRVLAACKQAAKEGIWKGPKEPGVWNGHCCPLLVTANLTNKAAFKYDEMKACGSFMAGYDLRDRLDVGDHRFYALGKAFRELAVTTGFKE